MAGKIQFQKLKSPACWLIAACWIFAAGCSFDSSLNEVNCDVEGRHSQGRICQDGRWVQLSVPDVVSDSADSVADDTQPLLDARSEDASADATPSSYDVEDGESEDEIEDDLDGSGEVGDGAGNDQDLDGEGSAADADVSDGGSDAANADVSDGGSDAANADVSDGGSDAADVHEESDADDVEPCSLGETRLCVFGGGQLGTDIQNQCFDGEETCQSDGSWSPCVEGVKAAGCQPDVCNGTSCGAANLNALCFDAVCCSPQTEEEICAQHGAECGVLSVSAENNCGVAYPAIGCGDCLGEAACNDSNQCQAQSCEDDDDCASGDCDDDICKADD